MEAPKRVAIVGGGISAMACSWKLRQHNFLVDIYESGSRLGGHANSVPFRGNGRSVDVDTGFIAMNEDTYPQFTHFLRALEVDTIPTDMSFGVSVNDGIFEWGSRSFRSFTGQFSNLLRPWFWRLLFDLLRFSYLTPHDVREHGDEDQQVLPDSQLELDLLTDLYQHHYESIGSYLRRQGYSEGFLRYVIIPMVAAPWCTDPTEFAREFPAKPLIDFMSYNSLLNTVFKTLRWRSFRNGSKTYVDAFQKTLPPHHKIHLNTPVQYIRRKDGAAVLELIGGSSFSYDHIVLAVHANQALRILDSEATELERNILSCFETRRNICYLHSDTTFLPRRVSARMAWNLSLREQLSSNCTMYDDNNDKRGTDESPKSQISLTFDMNKLQAIPNPDDIQSPGRVLVTMNPPRVPQSYRSVHVYFHPLITSKAIAASRHLHSINGVFNVSFAGAWMGWGFHEDGFVSGIHAAQILICGHDSAEPLDLFRLPQKPRQPESGVSRAAKWLIDLIQARFLVTTANGNEPPLS